MLLTERELSQLAACGQTRGRSAGVPGLLEVGRPTTARPASDLITRHTSHVTGFMINFLKKWFESV